MRTDYPAIAYFMTSYLHQDFMIEFGNFKMAVEQYIQNESRQSQRRLIVELNEILQCNIDQAMLTRIIFEQFACEYDFLSEWPSAGVWLYELKKQLLMLSEFVQ